MPTRDLANCKKVVAHVANAAITTTNTPSNGVDTQGYDACTFIVEIGAVANIANSPQPTWALKVQESDSVSSNFTDITDSARLITDGIKSPGTAPDSSSGVFLTIDDAAEDATAYHVGVISAKRYLRVVATAANTPGSTPYAVAAVLERASLQPVSN